MKNIADKINLGEKIGYFKKLFWLFLAVLISANIALFYFVNGALYSIGLIVGNIVLVWVLIPIFVWIGKTYLIEAGAEIAGIAKDEASGVMNEKVVKVVKKEEGENQG